MPSLENIHYKFFPKSRTSPLGKKLIYGAWVIEIIVACVSLAIAYTFNFTNALGVSGADALIISLALVVVAVMELTKIPLVTALYYSGKSRFSPIFVEDLTDIIYHVISSDINSNIIECVGPEVITFKELLEKLLNLINKKRLLVPFPLFLAKISAKLFQLLPNPPLTEDQLRLLKYDNVLSGKYKNNSDIGCPSKRYFDVEVKKYAYMWREGGQFSTEKYKTKENIEN